MRQCGDQPLVVRLRAEGGDLIAGRDQPWAVLARVTLSLDSAAVELDEARLVAGLLKVGGRATTVGLNAALPSVRASTALSTSGSQLAESISGRAAPPGKSLEAASASLWPVGMFATARSFAGNTHGEGAPPLAAEASPRFTPSRHPCDWDSVVMNDPSAIAPGRATVRG